MNEFKGKVAIITGAGSGFGREFARTCAARGMKLVLADIQADALEQTRVELEAKGVQVIARVLDVSDGAHIEALAATSVEAFGNIHLVFNNAGVGGSGGLVWENTERDWQWLLGVNLWGVIHGVRAFTPLMLEAAKRDPGYRGHIVNTASMAGMLNPPMMGPYNVSKHAVVSLTESLYQDLSLVTQQVACSVLCPYFVPTGIAKAHRNRPSELDNDTPPTLSQRVSRAMSEKAVSSGKVSAETVAGMVFDAIREEQFYIFSHPHALAAVKTRAEDIVTPRNPTDPFAERPDVRVQIIEALKG